jgi:hypothetical protein
MALVDDIFSTIPGPLIEQFGIAATYLKASSNESYNPETGTVLGVPAKISVKVIVAYLKAKEIDGMYQHGDMKILIPANYLGGYYPQTTDSIAYLQNGRTRTARIIDPISYRGDNPILHVVIARVN